MKYSQVLQTDYHTPLNVRNNDAIFEPKKIRNALGYTMDVKKISDIEMDG
jgi:ribosomal protein S17E